jgi:hypothetical protein
MLQPLVRRSNDPKVMLPSERVSRLAAFLIAGLLVAVCIRFNIFTAWGTDSASYLGAAYRWAEGSVFRPSSLVYWAPWSLDGVIESPLGHRPAPMFKGAIVSEYPLGYPLLLAAALNIGGDLAPHLVAPLFAGLLCWCSFLLGRHLSGPWAGVLSSLLVAASPNVLLQATQPMSDVPAAALWLLAWVLTLRRGVGAAIAAGLVVALAIAVRPNLAPLASVLAIALAVGSERARALHVVAFTVAASVGPALVLWSQAELYGHPLKPGYGGYEAFFSLSRVGENAALYPRLLIALHTGLPLSGLAMLALTTWRRWPSAVPSGARLITGTAFGLLAVNYTLFLPYLTYATWDALRFLMPGLAALFVLFAAFLDQVRSALAKRSRVLAILALLPIAIVTYPTRDESAYVFASTPTFHRVLMMGRYLREAAPRDAAILTYLQSGAAALYTGRMVVRLDLVNPKELDRVVDDLERRGYRPALVLDEWMESQSFRQYFIGSRYQHLDWPPRAEFAAPMPVWYMETRDRDPYRRGERWPMDVLVWPSVGRPRK